MKIIYTFLTVCGLVAAQPSQAPSPVQQSTENAARMTAGATPIYRVTVVARTTKAINYNHRSGSTNIDFRGTALLPEARGEARVESKQGVIKIALKYDPATKEPAIKSLERISRPGLRQYSSPTEFNRVKNGLGVAIVSTSKGVMTDKEAKLQNVGGEVLCYVY